MLLWGQDNVIELPQQGSHGICHATGCLNTLCDLAMYAGWKFANESRDDPGYRMSWTRGGASKLRLAGSRRGVIDRQCFAVAEHYGCSWQQNQTSRRV